MKIEFIVSPAPNTAGIGGSGTLTFDPKDIGSIRNLFKNPQIFPLDDKLILDKFYVTSYNLEVRDGVLIGFAKFKFLDYMDRLELL